MRHETMGTSDPIRHSTHASSRQARVDRPRLPSFKHLLDSLEQSTEFRDPCSSLIVLSTSTSASALDDQRSDRSSSKDTALDPKQVYSPGGDRDLRSVGVPSNARPCSYDPVSANVGDGSQKIDRRTDLPHAIRSWQTVPGRDETYRISKVSASRNCPPSCRVESTKSTWSRLRQGAIPRERSNLSCDAHQAQGRQLYSSHDCECLDNTQRHHPHRVAESPTRSCTHTQLSVSSFLTTLSSSPHVQQHLFDTSVPSAVPAHAIPSVVPRVTRQTAQNKAAGTSAISSPFSEIVPTNVPLIAGGKKFSSEADPASVDLSLTRHYLDIFFRKINLPIFGLLPKDRFMTWALECTCKSISDRIMLYALMSWASLHCTRPSSSGYRAVFKAIVYHEIGLLYSYRCLQVAHALLFLAFTEYGDHRHQAGADAFSKCATMIALLELDVEQEQKQELRIYHLPADLDAECRRRTVWVVFCFDAQVGLRNPFFQATSRTGTIIRLPQEDHLYDSGKLHPRLLLESDRGLAASFDTQDTNTLSEMYHMIQITRIHADINSNISRSQIAARSPDQDPANHTFRRCIELRLRIWAVNYDHTQQHLESIFYDAQNGRSDPHRSDFCAGRTAGLNILYHSSQMDFSRRIRHHGLSCSDFASHARKSTIHALAALGLAEHFTSRAGSEMRDHLFVSKGFVTVHTIVQAVDIITAVGRVADYLEPGSRIMRLLYSALELLDALGLWWGHDFVRYREVERRIQVVFRFAEAALKVGKKFFYCSNPMDDTISKDFDLIYGSDRKHYMRLAYADCALNIDNDVFAIDTSR